MNKNHIHRHLHGRDALSSSRSLAGHWPFDNVREVGLHKAIPATKKRLATGRTGFWAVAREPDTSHTIGRCCSWSTGA